MKVRFSVVAFVPPNAQLGVVGSPPFLGEWDVKKCLPLLPYSSPHASGQEPSLWFRDIDVPGIVTRAGAAGRAAAGSTCAGRGGTRDVGDIAIAAASKREECADAGCYIVSNGRDRREATSACNRCGDTSNNWFYSSNGSKWSDRSCCDCGTCLNSSSNCCFDNAWRGRCVDGGSCSRITDSTRCTGSSTGRHSVGNNICVRGSRAIFAAGGAENSCEDPAAARAGHTHAEDPTLPEHCAICHTAGSVGHTHTGLPGAVPITTTATHVPRLCRPYHEGDVTGDTDFAWELLLATSPAQSSTRYAAAAAATEGNAGNSCCRCQTEDVNDRGCGLSAAAGSCRCPWKHQTFQSSSRQPLQENLSSTCEPASLYYTLSTSPEHQGHQIETIQAPLRRCCRRRDQALSSVEGAGCRGNATAAGERSDGLFMDAAAAAGQQYSCGDFVDAPGMDPSRCMHAQFYGEQQNTYREPGAPGDAETGECDSVCGAATYSIDPRIPAVLHLLESHPLKQVQFEYKFILWYPPSEKAALPCFPSAEPSGAASANAPEAYFRGSGPGAASADERGAAARGTCGPRVPTTEGTAEAKARGRWSEAKRWRGWAACMQRERRALICRLHRYNCSSSAPEENWRAWLFPPAPPRLPTPPEAKEVLVWEGTGPEQNRKFVFDPFDVVVDLNRRGELQCLYICKVAHFRDPRAGGTGEYELTSRFYNSVRSESRMHFARICPGLYVGSCPRQLLHIRLLKEELKVTCIFNLQTEQDICNNYPDPMATARSAEDVSHLYDSQGLRYVWLPTADMRDSARKTACANAAFLLLGLIESGHCVYVHCNAGVGRSVAAVSAFLCFAIGLDLRKVNFLICAKRPVAFWDEKAMKYGLGDYTHKFGNCTVVGDTFNKPHEGPPFCCA